MPKTGPRHFRVCVLKQKNNDNLILGKEDKVRRRDASRKSALKYDCNSAGVH